MSSTFVFVFFFFCSVFEALYICRHCNFRTDDKSPKSPSPLFFSLFLFLSNHRVNVSCWSDLYCALYKSTSYLVNTPANTDGLTRSGWPIAKEESLDRTSSRGRNSGKEAQGFSSARYREFGHRKPRSGSKPHGRTQVNLNGLI